jgi:hypothetical protein
VLASTEDLLSTSGWRKLPADFATGPQTRLIAIKVMRVPGNPLIKVRFGWTICRLIVLGSVLRRRPIEPKSKRNGVGMQGQVEAS